MKVNTIMEPRYKDALYTTFIAARCCYSSKGYDELSVEFESARAERLVRHLIKLGHLSVIEHVSVTFFVADVSRALTHQLVRHRLASYSQQSQRHVKAGDVIVPGEIAKHKDALVVFDDICKSSKDAYNRLLELGMKKEDARAVLPNATKTNIVMTMNLRELRHFIQMRATPQAQTEIRTLAKFILWKMLALYPAFFGDLEELLYDAWV